MTILYQDPRFLQHRTGNHPETPARLASLPSRLIAEGLTERCKAGVLHPATIEDVARLHSRRYINEVIEFATAGGGRIEADTVVSPDSHHVALLAAGAALSAVNDVLSGVDRTALCLVRPPGHHALPTSAMGFCLYNNVALAAEYALRVHDLERILIVDWDVHHGNGTQDMFYDRDDVWFFSSHRFPFYPGTGASEETGAGKGLGATFNLPIAYGTPRKEFLARFESMLVDVAQRCQPQLVLISAGFDAHRLDPIGSLDLETEDFATLTTLVTAIAGEYANGRMVSVLEGGYHIEALADSVSVHLETLLSCRR